MKYFNHNNKYFLVCLKLHRFVYFYEFCAVILPHTNSGFISSGLQDQSFYDLECLCGFAWQKTEQDLAGRVSNYKDDKIMTILSYYKI